jgi:hypothetical protein
MPSLRQLLLAVGLFLSSTLIVCAADLFAPGSEWEGHRAINVKQKGPSSPGASR